MENVQISEDSLSNWKDSTITLSGVEALMLLSLHNTILEKNNKALFTDDEILKLRFIIYCFSKRVRCKDSAITLPLQRLQKIESVLPMFGLFDETILMNFRGKINRAILELQTIIFDVEETPLPLKQKNETRKRKRESSPKNKAVPITTKKLHNKENES